MFYILSILFFFSASLFGMNISSNTRDQVTTSKASSPVPFVFQQYEQQLIDTHKKLTYNILDYLKLTPFQWKVKLAQHKNRYMQEFKEYNKSYKSCSKELINITHDELNKLRSSDCSLLPLQILSDTDDLITSNSLAIFVHPIEFKENYNLKDLRNFTRHEYAHITNGDIHIVGALEDICAEKKLDEPDELHALRRNRESLADITYNNSFKKLKSYIKTLKKMHLCDARESALNEYPHFNSASNRHQNNLITITLEKLNYNDPKDDYPTTTDRINALEQLLYTWPKNQSNKRSIIETTTLSKRKKS